eukprot:g77060.t1
MSTDMESVKVKKMRDVVSNGQGAQTVKVSKSDMSQIIMKTRRFCLDMVSWGYGEQSVGCFSQKPASFEGPIRTVVSRPWLRYFLHPPLEIQSVETDALAKLLSNPDKFSGTVVTSQNGVEALREALATENLSAGTTVDQWHTLPLYALGPATARSAQAAGFGHIRQPGPVRKVSREIKQEKEKEKEKPDRASTNANNANAEGLARFISETHTDKDQPLLVVVGNKRREELPAGLTANRIRYQEIRYQEFVVAYHALPTSTF